MTVGDAELRGRARIRWEIRRGTRAELSFLAEGVGEDLQVEGPLVSRWRREGADVIVELGGETKGLVDLDLRWSVAAPPGAEASVPLPTLAPHEVFRSDAAVQIARDGEIDVRPELSGWSPIASVQLPEWAEGLVEGTPTAAFSRARSSEGSASLELLRLEPVPGPPMVVDVADVLVATTDEGRAVMRARFEIRNERASHLLVMPPPGMRPVGVTVAGRHVRPSVVEGGALRIPLKRSIETVQGALTVPVTVGLVGEGEAWARRERRELALPAVDAPVSVGRVTLVLPPRYRSRLEPGQGAVVDDFDRGDEVGYGLRDDGQVARADQLFARAVDAWNDNDFEATQAELDDLAELGAHGGNVAGLQANVDLVRPRELVSRWEPAPEEAMATDSVVYDFEDDEMAPMKSRSISSRRPARPAPPPASALERRIRARARARSGEKKAQFERSKSKAKQYKDEGNYEAAAEEYRRAIEDSRDLDALEDEESVEYEFEADQLEGELRAVEAAAAEDPGGGEAESGGGGDEGGDSELLPRDGEFDLVSAAVVAWLGLDEPDSELEPETEPETEPPVETEPETVATVAKDPPEPLAGAVVRVPWAGEVVRYQVLLLEAGEQRGLRIDARKATSTLDRRGRWSR
ncbi:MAG: hypothetical protein H6712_03480 [Myxococcales bacterium]|nr:hypothetical protein [Myxococcales bacterium]